MTYVRIVTSLLDVDATLKSSATGALGVSGGTLIKTTYIFL